MSPILWQVDIHDVRRRPQKVERFVSLLLTFQRPRKKMSDIQDKQQRRLKNSFCEIFTIGYHIALPVSKIQLKSIQSILYIFIFTECQPG